MSFFNQLELMDKASLLKSLVNQEPASVSESCIETFPLYELIELLKASLL